MAEIKSQHGRQNGGGNRKKRQRKENSKNKGNLGKGFERKR